MTTNAVRPYHHGDLRRVLLAAAVDVIDQVGPTAMSVRAVARAAAVSHAAVTYHFGDKSGLLAAVAADGYRMLAHDLDAAQRERGSFLDVGVAYVHFAVTHRAHFDVMYRPELYDADDAEMLAARSQAATMLYGRGPLSNERIAAGVAAWSLVHGVATLWLNGNLPARLGTDPETITRRVASYLDLGQS